VGELAGVEYYSGTTTIEDYFEHTVFVFTKKTHSVSARYFKIDTR
jgi:hypothetical protein